MKESQFTYGKKLLSFIQKGFEAFEQLVNKELHYLYIKGTEVSELVVKAKKEHFMHLCGVKYYNPKTKKPVTAKHFYDLVKDNKVNADSIIVKEDGTPGQKL